MVSIALLFGIGNLLSTSGTFPAVANLSAYLLSENNVPKAKTIFFKLDLPARNTSTLHSADDGADTQQAGFAPDKPKAGIVEPLREDAQMAPRVEPSRHPLASIELVEQSPTPEPPIPEPLVHQVTVRRGDSLYNLFNALGISQRELISVTKGEGKQLRRIHPGQILEFHLSQDGALDKLIYQVDEVHSNHFMRVDSGFEIESVEVPLDRRRALARGEIDSSLFLAGQAAGLPDRTIMEMAEIFGWDVDFALDIRSGDDFSIVYEELYSNGEKVRNGAILAAQFTNQGRSIRAVRYTDENGRSRYYSPSGDSMRKAFLRTPVEFSRISSHFGKRKHPVLSTVRNHNGVDYAARTGTPIKVTGDGRIEFVGTKGGYGRTVVVRHGSLYTTLYAHMSSVAKGVKNGKAVRQGQTIGYVGSSGLATGPHLHYEFRVRGVHRNPLKVELPKAAPIAVEFLQDFKKQTRELALQLDSLASTQIASND